MCIVIVCSVIIAFVSKKLDCLSIGAFFFYRKRQKAPRKKVPFSQAKGTKKAGHKKCLNTPETEFVYSCLDPDPIREVRVYGL